MKVVILCGGQGTRLREETEYRPKPMVSVGGRPVIWHIMRRYAHFGFKDFVLCLGYRGNMIKEYFLDYEALNNDFTISFGEGRKITYHSDEIHPDLSVTLSNTGEAAMTGARIKKIQKYINDDLFMVTYGDGLVDLDILKLIEFHKSHGKLATVTAVQPNSRYGEMALDQSGCVEHFSEKPPTNGWASAGYFVFDKRVFDYLNIDDSCVLEKEPLMKLATDKQLAAYQHDGFFFAMDTYREYLHLNKLWDNGQAPWVIKE